MLFLTAVELLLQHEDLKQHQHKQQQQQQQEQEQQRQQQLKNSIHDENSRVSSW
jgi:hypothetical protein